MLRPAVAAANAARPGKASGLDIARRSGSVKSPDTACCARPVRQSARAVAARQRRPENSVIVGKGESRPSPKRSYWPGGAIIPDKTSLSPRISKTPPAHYDGGALEQNREKPSLRENWLASNGYVSSRRTCRIRR